MNNQVTAKYYRDLHILEVLKHDVNLETASVIGINPSTFLDLKVKPYLKMVFLSTLSRLTPIEILEILNDSIEELSEETYNPTGNNKAGNLTLLLREKINLKKIAEEYGLEVKSNKMVCPFHSDTDASLVIYPKTNSFFCFGCRTGGDVIEFYRRMEELK